MTVDIKFHEAAEGMNPGDVFSPNRKGWSDFELYIDINGVKCFKNEDIERITLSPGHFNIIGQIIKAVPKALTNDEISKLVDGQLDFMDSTSGYLRNCFIKIFDTGDQNGALRRDLELRPVVEECIEINDLFDAGIKIDEKMRIHRICVHIKNLPPLNKNG